MEGGHGDGGGFDRAWTKLGQSDLHSADADRYHDENTREEDLIHPEDIAHFKKHDEMEEEEERMEALSRRAIVAENIPQKFRIHY